MRKNNKKTNASPNDTANPGSPPAPPLDNEAPITSTPPASDDNNQTHLQDVGNINNNDPTAAPVSAEGFTVASVCETLAQEASSAIAAGVTLAALNLALAAKGFTVQIRHAVNINGILLTCLFAQPSDAADPDGSSDGIVIIPKLWLATAMGVAAFDRWTVGSKKATDTSSVSLYLSAVKAQDLRNTANIFKDSSWL